MCEFFKWHDGVMSFRATEVIKELLGTIERLEARAELGKKNQGIMRIAFAAIVVAWVVMWFR